jgi:hypothetical protein
LSTVEGYAIKSWLEANGNQADILFNDVGYTPHILNTEYDVLILKAPGFVFFGGEIDKRISQFLEFLAGWKDRKVKLWVIHNDCGPAFSSGLSELNRSLDKVRIKDPNGDRERMWEGAAVLERLYRNGIKLLCPGGKTGFRTKECDSWLKYEFICEPRINQLLATLAFPKIPEVENPAYDVAYAGVWRSGRRAFLERVLNDDRFSSVSNCSGKEKPGREVELDLEIENHREIEGFRYLEQQAWYNRSLCQIIVSDPGTFGTFVSARWFTALRTNSIPLIQLEFDCKRELLRNGEDLNWLYVDSSEDVCYAVQRLKDDSERLRVLSEIHNLKEPWFVVG